MFCSFKQFLIEMARSTSGKGKGSPIPIFDEHDQEYYKHIIDNAPSKVKDDPDLMRLLVRQAICLRYGSRTHAGMLEKLHAEDKDIFDYTFNLKGKIPITIKDIPMFPQQVVDKVKQSGFAIDRDSFGYAFGQCSSPDMGKRALSYIKFFEDGEMPAKKDLYYHPKFDDAAQSADYEDRSAYVKHIEKGVKKGRDFEEVDGLTKEKSMEKIPLDDEDKKYLQSVKEKFLESVKDKVGVGAVISEEDAISRLPKILSWALGLRYSDHWITEDGKGFKVKDVFRTAQNSDGIIRGELQIPGKNKQPLIRINDVYINLPHLVEKFNKFKKSRNFVKEPVLNFAMLDQRKVAKAEGKPDPIAIGMQAMTRWQDRGTWNPNNATRGSEALFDPAFYEQISKDWEKWRTRDSEVVHGNEVNDPELAEKLAWRKPGSNLIVQSPNIKDFPPFAGRDDESMSWYELMEDDVKRGVKAELEFLAKTVYVKNPEWKSKLMQSEMDYDSIVQQALYQLMHGRVGSKEYRSEKNRNMWVKRSVDKTVASLMKQRATGQAGLEKDDIHSGAEDKAVTHSAGNYNVQTGRQNHRIDEPDDDVTYDVTYDDFSKIKPNRKHGFKKDNHINGPSRIDEPDDDDIYSDYEKDIEPVVAPEKDPQDWDAYINILQNQNKNDTGVLTRPTNIPFKTWVGLSRADKIAAMKKAGLASPDK